VGEIVTGWWDAVGVFADDIGGAQAMKGAGIAAAAGAALAGGSVGYKIDRDHIPGLIEDLNKGLDQVRHAGTDAQQYGIITSPGGDPYSPHAVKAMGPDLVANHAQANTAYQESIKNMIASLKKAHGGYGQAEDDATSAMNKQDGGL
jgi:hypothetical protein